MSLWSFATRNLRVNRPLVRFPSVAHRLDGLAGEG
jgi:hypothetical protein